MRKIIMIFALVVFGACDKNDDTPAQVSKPPPKTIAENTVGTILFEDNFDKIDESKWVFEIGNGCPDLCGWGNNEKQSYTRENAMIVDGVLVITARKTKDGYTSSRIKTQGKFDFRFGKIEARIKLPVGNGTWPAFWMLGSNIETVGWPACGEIDILEHSGSNPGVVSSALHREGASFDAGETVIDPSGFHIYTLDWTPSLIQMKVDGKIIHSYGTRAPFDRNFFLLLNLAMGGNFQNHTVDTDFESATYEIDYIKITKN